MNELEACSFVADLLKAVGFEHRWTSMKSEACYYALPGQREVLRVAEHRYGGAEFGVAPVIVCITITASNCWLEPKLHEMTARAIGFYHLRAAGRVPLTAKERARRHGHRNRAARSLVDRRVDIAQAAGSIPAPPTTSPSSTS